MMSDLSIAFSVLLLIGILVGFIGIVALVVMIFETRVRRKDTEL